MMNLLAICLVLTSLLAAEVWSPIAPTTAQQNQKEGDVIVKEGHRTIVVETFDQDGHHNTKVSISPEIKHDTVSSSMYEKAKEEARVLPNLCQGISPEGKFYDGGRHTPGELICDALGKCTHKIASAMGGAKDKVSEAAHEAVAGDKGIKHEALEMAEKAIFKKKKIAGEAKDKVEEAYDKTKDAAEKSHHAKEAVEHAYEDIKESAKESLHRAKQAAKDAVELGDTIRKDVGRNVSEEVMNVKEKAEEKEKEAKESTKRAKDRVSGFLKHTWRHMVLPAARNNVTGMLNLLGFSSAYGMCVWVTFVSSHVLAGALARQQFGVVQSKIYPVYFRALLGCIGAALLGHLVGQRNLLLTSRAKRFQAYNLLASMLLVLVNASYLESAATKVMFERMRLEKEEGRGLGSQQTRESEQQPDATPAWTTTSAAAEVPPPVAETPEQQEVGRRIAKKNQNLKKLNSYSSFLNILTLTSLTWHLVYLGHALHVRC